MHTKLACLYLTTVDRRLFPPCSIPIVQYCNASTLCRLQHQSALLDSIHNTVIWPSIKESATALTYETM